MPLPAFIAPPTFYQGDILCASQVNVLVKNALYLHGLYAGGYEPFTGIYISPDHAPAGEVARWYFNYRNATGTSAPYIYHNITGAGITIKVQTDGSELSFTPAFANPLDLTAGTFTEGKQYYIRLVNTLANSVQVDYIYTLQAQPSSHQTLAAFTDGNLSDYTDWTTLATEEQYLQALLEAPHGTFRGLTGQSPGGSTVITYWNGSFVYRGLNTFNLSYTLSTGGHLFVKCSDIGGGNVRTICDLATPYGTKSVTADLSTLSPALSVGTRYRLYAYMADTSNATVKISRMFFTGAKTLTSMPVPFNTADYGRGSAGNPRAKAIADTLTDLRLAADYQTVVGTDHPIMYATPDNSSPTLVGGPTINYSQFESFRRVRRYRYLRYLPTGPAAKGTMNFGDTFSQNLPDVNGDGSWCAYDLSAVPSFQLGMIYQVHAVKACFETAVTT